MVQPVIDKLVMLSPCEMLIVYTNKPTVRLYDSTGDIVNFTKWFFSTTVIKLPDYKRRDEADMEITINQEAA